MSEIGGGLEQLGSTTKPLPYRCWLFDGTELRRITAVVDDTHLTIEEAFTNPLVASAVKFVPQSRAMQISYVALGNGAIVDGNTLTDGEFGGFGETSDATVNCDPIIIDASEASVRVNVFYFT